MTFIDATRSIERQRFFDGQRLLASDLQGIEAFNREMRWLHNQSLHQPGIGDGFAVSGGKGEREIGVGSGYAVDDLGREIVLTGSRTIPVPPVSGDAGGKPKRYALTVRYPEDEDLEEVELREGICDTRGAVRLREEPIFCWVALNPDGSPERDQQSILSGRHLVVTEAAVRECKLDGDLGIAQRRNARPAVQPRVACGAARPTAWRSWNPWDEEEPSEGVQVASALRTLYSLVGGLQADIDTRTAGFLTTPGYFARIDGSRIYELEIGEQTRQVVLDGLLSVVRPAPTGFTAQVLVLAFAIPSPGDGGTLRAEPPDEDLDLVELLKEWQVGWMGVEG
ncbi:hypothetical protein [Streptosporangium sp. KLBMP 9127]|nr:hypothetical protein [Streptosporangium sp. KLBMP 9127]